ncbi:MAG: SGNH/GDSL hydrolase family protein [Polyangiaceae bacterium]|nr:SGNH/GDSL hydrolase family protein [Polyangiaceae bacterium]MBK8936484.1 SGNH/GDSL hydrolase family protein [Polyangiaceae bacterium]
MNVLADSLAPAGRNLALAALALSCAVEPFDAGRQLGEEPSSASASSSATPSSRGPAPDAPAGIAPPLELEALGGTFPKPAASAAAPKAGACAPSLSHRRSIDARTSAALERCEPLKTGLEKASRSCGMNGNEVKDFERFAASVPPLSDAALARVREVFARGRTLGRDPKVFGLVGDSITVSRNFLGAFAADSGRNVALSPWVERALTLPSGATVIDHFRGGVAERRGAVTDDPFECFRAAKVGARASWACELEEAGKSPVEELVERLNPAYAIVTFGANDAAYRIAPPETIADEFEAHILKAVESLESRGVVVILSNEMRHGDQPGVKACPGDAPANDWRVAVCTNATSARAAEVACREHLPFIDLRHALDAATNYGLGPDGVHLTSFKRGAGVLDEAGLDCGNNVRNLVSLLALKRVVEALDGG